VSTGQVSTRVCCKRQLAHRVAPRPFWTRQSSRWQGRAGPTRHRCGRRPRGRGGTRRRSRVVHHRRCSPASDCSGGTVKVLSPQQWETLRTWVRPACRRLHVFGLM